LEDIQIKAVQRLLRAKLLLEVVVSGKEISKNTLVSDEIKFYKTRKLQTVEIDFKAANISLMEDQDDVDRYSSKKKEKKEPKKSTVLETYELWQQKHTILEIALIRKYTTETILSHLTKLIQTGTLTISDVLDPEKITDLTAAFEGYAEETVSPLKEKYGEKFTWSELRMYKASLNVN
jgi:uncharacterized protein YpbB